MHAYDIHAPAEEQFDLAVEANRALGESGPVVPEVHEEIEVASVGREGPLWLPIR